MSTSIITVDPAERASLGIAIAGTGLAILLALMAPAPAEAPVEKLPVDDAPIVALTEVPEPEAPKKPEPEKPRPPEPRPQPRPQPAPPVPQTPPPVPTPSPAPAVEPVKETPIPPAETPPPPPPVSKPAPPRTADVESGYVAKLRSHIRSITAYPTSGEARRERPEGATEVRFTLNRSGQASAVEVERSSGSRILDRQAITIVKGGSYPAMPAEAWVGAADHVFTVTVQFTAP